MLNGDKLNLFDEVPPEEDPDEERDSDWEERPGPPKEEYEIMRKPKECLLDQDEKRLQFVIKVKSIASKYREKTLIVSVPVAVNKYSGEGKSNYAGSFGLPSPAHSQVTFRTGASQGKISKQM